VRPTSDRVREALFQCLQSRYGVVWEDVVAMDFFAGSGAMGIEALSRGACAAAFVESDRNVFSTLKKNVDTCGLADRASLFLCDVFKGIARDLFRKAGYPPVTLLFADPPYGKGLSARFLQAVSSKGSFLAQEGMLLVEDRKNVVLDSALRGREVDLELKEVRVYGDTSLFIYFFRKRSGEYSMDSPGQSCQK